VNLHAIRERGRTPARRVALTGLAAVLIALPMTAAAATGAPAARAADRLTWTACGGDLAGLQCATLPVPVAWSDPAGPAIGLRLAKIPAAAPAAGAPSIQQIPGGPGAGIEEVLHFAGLLHLDQWAQQHDIYLFDPRGIGASHPVRCTRPDPFPPGIITSQAQLDAWARVNRGFADSCEAGTGPLMRHLSSADTARDIDAIRLAIGQTDGLVAYSASYGTSYAAAYLELGRPVRALILDAVVDHTVSLPTFAGRVARAHEDAFNRFARWCEGSTGCALRGQDVSAVFDRLIAAAPLPAPHAPRPATATEIRARVGSLMSGGRQFGWPVAAALLAQAAAGDASGFVGEPAGTGLFQGVQCGDFDVPADFQQLSAPVAALRQQAPRFGEWKYWDIVGGCAGYLPAANPPHRLSVHPTSRVLVGNDTHDPSTPLVNALSVWSEIGHAKLLIADTDGHQALVMSPCAAAAYLRFLDHPTTLPRLIRCDS
jgi:alpha/beta hydrolase fold